LYELFESTLATKWHQSIVGWFDGFDEETVSYLADGLYAAMCEDVEVQREY
jgi:hypothetical protein